MNVLSVDEGGAVKQEADSICTVAETFGDKLRKIRCGNKDVISGKSFICISSDKNIILRVEGDYKWYLKFSLKSEWIQHEIAGGEAVRTRLGNYPGYQHPKAIRASIEHLYTLYSAIRGKSFNRIVLESCVFRRGNLPDSTVSAMESFGRILGMLHSYDNPTGLVALNPTSVSYLRDYLSKISQQSVVMDKITEWAENWNSESEGHAFIHGNIKSEDIFFDNDRVGIIDFGTCGFGDRYEDLTNLFAYLMLLKTVPLFPWSTPKTAMNLMLRGYESVQNIDAGRLSFFVSLGVIRYYLKNCVIHSGVATLSGMPIMKAKLEHMVLQLLRQEYEEAFDGVHL